MASKRESNKPAKPTATRPTAPAGREVLAPKEAIARRAAPEDKAPRLAAPHAGKRARSDDKEYDSAPGGGSDGDEEGERNEDDKDGVDGPPGAGADEDASPEPPTKRSRPDALATTATASTRNSDLGVVQGGPAAKEDQLKHEVDGILHHVRKQRAQREERRAKKLTDQQSEEETWLGAPLNISIWRLIVDLPQDTTETDVLSHPPLVNWIAAKKVSRPALARLVALRAQHTAWFHADRMKSAFGKHVLASAGMVAEGKRPWRIVLSSPPTRSVGTPPLVAIGTAAASPAPTVAVTPGDTTRAVTLTGPPKAAK